MLKNVVFAVLSALFGTIFLAGLTCPNVCVRGQVTAESDVEEIYLSGWVKEHSQLGITSFRAGELFMSAKKPAGYFYVLIAPEDFVSVGHTTSVTLRNVLGRTTSLGYGLIFHSNPTPLQQDYAFLIDTVKKRYRVIRHVPLGERSVVKWTSSTFIRSGRRINVLEVEDKGDHVDLYINRRFVQSVETPLAFKNGQPGIYTDGTTIAFKALTLTKVNTRTAEKD